MNELPMIKLEDCKDGYLYFISARNAQIGVYRKEELGFVISRTKFSDNYLFTEYHWNIGQVKPDMECFGTAQPMKEIGPVPAMNKKDLLKYLNEQTEILKDERSNHCCTEPRKIVTNPAGHFYRGISLQ